MSKSSNTYRERYAAIASYVSFRYPKRLTRAAKAKITRYHNRIGRAISRGYRPVKAKDDGRIKAAHALQGIKGMPDMRVAFVKPPGNGFRLSITKDGTIRATNSATGVSKVTLRATFFPADEYDTDAPEVLDEAKRLRADARKALGHKPQRCAVAYWGGENAWAETSFLNELLVVDLEGYGDRPYPADGVTFYWIKQNKRIAQVQQRLRDQRSDAAAKRAARRRRSDV